MNKFEELYWKRGILHYIVLTLGIILSFGVLFLVSQYFVLLLLIAIGYTLFSSNERVDAANIGEFNARPNYNNNLSQYMSAKEKREYLKSSKWKTLRDLMYILHDSKCECCGNSESLEVHHNTYEHLGSEYFYQT
jgi:hypothetical protein